MKPVQVAILVVAGAIAGAVVMGVWQRPRAVPAASAVAQVPQPAVAVQPAPEVQPQAVAAAEPAPVVRAAKPAAPRTVPAPAASPVAEAPPPEMPKEAAPPSPPPPPENPPARTEPEHATPPPPPPEPHRVTLNAGLLIPVRLVDGLSWERNKPGDTFIAALDKELVVDGFVIAERGARVEGRVAASDQGGKVKGVAALAVELTRLHTADGQNIAILTDRFERRAEATHQQDAANLGAGGAAGAGGVLLTRGKPASLSSETRLSFRLRAPVTLTEKLYLSSH